MPADMESVQVPTYFFFAGSQADVPWPWKGAPAITLLKSLIRHSPPQPIVLVSVPLLVIGGAPGAMNISTVASQVPASISSTLCSGPGFGIGMSCATAGLAKTSAAARPSAALVRYRTFIVTSCEIRERLFLPGREDGKDYLRRGWRRGWDS